MRNLLIAALALAAGIVPAPAQDTAPKVSPAIDGILDAFKTHSLVGIGEHHRIAQELEFYAALVRDPRFAREVGNVVVEFGGAAHQDIIDRYVDGQDIPYTELRKVWTDTVGWLPVVTAIGYPNFFAQVRETNLALPPQERIHVWLGEPVIDWDKIKTHQDWLALDRTRDEYPVEVIERNILARGKKALVIYGGGHFDPPVPGSAGEKLDKAGWRNTNLAAELRRKHPGALFVALFYAGTANKACTQDTESRMKDWPVPALMAPARGSYTVERMRACSTLRIEDASFPPGLTDAEKQAVVENTLNAPAAADALVYLGPSDTLTYSPYIADLYLDDDYHRTVARHWVLQMEKPFPTYFIREYTMPAKKVRP